MFSSAQNEYKMCKQGKAPSPETAIERQYKLQAELQAEMTIYANLQAFGQFQYGVLTTARVVKENEDTLYRWCTFASYLAFFLGWLLAFIGRVTGAEQVAENQAG